jgi:RNA polymerase sigma-70 factor (ECF subfamily)
MAAIRAHDAAAIRGGAGLASTLDRPRDGPPTAWQTYVGRAMRDSERDERRRLRAARDGSAPDLEALFRTHWQRAYRAAYLVVHDAAAAEDIAQEAFISAVRALDRFDRRRPFGPWLHRIVVNRAIDWSRARAIRREVMDVGDAAEATAGQSGSGPEPHSRSSPYSDEVTAALASLSPEHRAVVVMRYLLEYTPREIAAALSLPRGTVNSRLRRGLDRLASELEEQR